MNTVMSLAIAVFLYFVAVSKATDLATEKLILENILSDSRQNTMIRPPGINGSDPVIVETNVYIRRIGCIDDMNKEFQAQLTFRQKWNDRRLAYNKKYPKFGPYVTLLAGQNIWKPDGFFSNEDEAHYHNVLEPNKYIRIYPNGDVLYNARITLTLSCPMDFTYFPLDEQKCPIIYASYGYTTDQVIFLWKPSIPVQLSSKLQISKFEISGFTTDYCTSTTNTGEYSCLKLQLDLSRKSNYYEIRVYIPFSMLVIISWMPFWLNSREIVGRFSILVGVLITMAVITASNYDIIPQVSYTKAIDIWNGVCWTFLMAAFIELIIVAQISAGEIQVIDVTDSQDSKLGKCFKGNTRSQQIDIIARILYPASFILFNIIYWAVYL